MARRFDASPISGVTRLPFGGIRVGARFTRAGDVLSYRQPDGSMRREFRPESEVFAPGVLEALRAAPVTDLHPGGGRDLVRADTWADVAVGHVGDDVRASEDKRFLEGSVVIGNAIAVRRVHAGERPEVSFGYEVDLEMTPGVSPTGEAYDAIQRNIRPNHVALVPRGRAGAEVGLRLDADDNEIRHGSPMKIKIAGKDYEAGSPEAIDAERAEKVRTDAADAEIKRLRAAQSRALRTDAKRAGVEVRADADDQSVMVDAVKRIAPDVDLSSASPEFVAGAFAVAIAIALKAMGAEKAPEKPAAPPPAADGAAGARADAIDALRHPRTPEPTETAEDVRARVLEARRAQAFAGL